MNQAHGLKTYAFRGSAHLQPLVDEYRALYGMASDSEVLRACAIAGLRAGGVGGGTRLGTSGRGRGRPKKGSGDAPPRFAGLCDLLGGVERYDESGNPLCDYRTYAAAAGGAVQVAEMTVPVSLIATDALRTQYRDLMGQPVEDEAERAEMRAKANGDA